MSRKYLERDTYNPIDVEMVLAGHFPATEVRCPEKAAAVQVLTQRGFSSEDISVQLGISSRQVIRLRELPVKPPERVTFDLSESRVLSLSSLVGYAQKTVGGMRDDVESVWSSLLRLSPQRLRELVMVLAAMVPDDAKPSELLAWVAEFVEEDVA